MNSPKFSLVAIKGYGDERKFIAAIRRAHKSGKSVMDVKRAIEERSGVSVGRSTVHQWIQEFCSN